MKFGFNLSSGVTDTLESSSILIYLKKRKSIYTQKVCLIKTKWNYTESIVIKLESIAIKKIVRA